MQLYKEPVQKHISARDTKNYDSSSLLKFQHIIYLLYSIYLMLKYQHTTAYKFATLRSAVQER